VSVRCGKAVATFLTIMGGAGAACLAAACGGSSSKTHSHDGRDARGSNDGRHYSSRRCFHSQSGNAIINRCPGSGAIDPRGSSFCQHGHVHRRRQRHG